MLSDESRVDVSRCDVVDGHGELLVFGIAQIIVVLEVGAFFGGDDSLHQFHGRVVLSGVVGTFRLHDDFRELTCVGFQLHVEHLRCRCVDGDRLRLIAHSGKGKLPAIVSLDGVFTHGVAAYRDVMAAVGGAGVEDCVALLGVDDHTTELSVGGEGEEEEKQ